MSIRSVVALSSILFLVLSGIALAVDGPFLDRKWSNDSWPINPLPVDDDEFCDDGFDDGVAGSYYLDGTLSIPQPDGSIVDLPFFGLQTYGEDGTLVTTDNGSFVNPATPQSPGHGSWVRTGALQLTNSAYIFLFGDTFGIPGDGFCDDADPTPLAYCLIAVPVGTVDFAPDFATGVTNFETKLWVAGTNPAVDPPLFPFPTAFGTANVTRVDGPASSACDDDEGSD